MPICTRQKHLQCQLLFQSGKSSLQSLNSLELGLQRRHSSSAYFCVLLEMTLEEDRTRSLLDQGRNGGSNEPKIAKIGQLEHVERSNHPRLMRGSNESLINLCTSAMKARAWHHCTMHATPRKTRAPKMPNLEPVGARNVPIGAVQPKQQRNL